jgi:GT2 family glycosyltransferase
MYIRRTCLDEVGLFDAERFGRGYGEENDFCRRAAAGAGTTCWPPMSSCSTRAG